jgi:hypothetical protein
VEVMGGILGGVRQRLRLAHIEARGSIQAEPHRKFALNPAKRAHQ